MLRWLEGLGMVLLLNELAVVAMAAFTGAQCDHEREREEMLLENAGLLPYPFAA